ncbi:hypothetical protein HYZ99_02585 [Candidatus Peregrinibacteria bacterium]|nr:hypothetical protein [Candidatus Peregrinibacteria bacterium]
MSQETKNVGVAILLSAVFVTGAAFLSSWVREYLRNADTIERSDRSGGSDHRLRKQNDSIQVACPPTCPSKPVGRRGKPREGRRRIDLHDEEI